MVVLFLEDEPSQQEALGMMLTLLGFTVLRARDVDEALAHIDERLDAAVLDVRIPDPKARGRNGLTVLGEVRARHSSIPIAIFTGDLLSDDDKTFAHHHRAKVFYKPQTYDLLIDFLSRPVTSLPPPRSFDRRPLLGR